jgi:aminomethyltransferase
MGQIEVFGPASNSWLNKLLSNNVERLAITQGQYTFLLNEQGGVIDDLIVYRLHDNEYFLVVNAAKIDEDFAWMQGHLSGDVSLLN